MLPRIDSGTTTSIEPDDDEDEVTTTSSSTTRERIDLGRSGATGGNQRFDLGRNKAAAVETSDNIKEAGGPDAVLASTDEQVSAINNAVSDVSGQIRDQKANADPEPERPPEPDEQDLPPDPGEQDLPPPAQNPEPTPEPTPEPRADPDPDPARPGVGPFGALVSLVGALVDAVQSAFGGR